MRTSGERGAAIVWGSETRVQSYLPNLRHGSAFCGVVGSFSARTLPEGEVFTNRIRRVVSAGAGLLVAGVPMVAGAQGGRPRPVTTANAMVSVPFDSLAFTGLRWREIGPFRGGRSVAATGSAARPNEYY